MQIRRIEVRDFRKLSHVVVENLEDGLNVLVGDNEAGKSTLLAALRAGLFEKHRVSGDVAARMQPFGQSVRPEVSIDFELEGDLWKLRKAFCQRPEAELVGPRERITGDAVEERLAELFRFTPPGRGQSKPEEHQGIYGLLWVEQGLSYRSLGVGAGRDMIASALEREVGEVIGGESGRALLTAAEDRRNAFWDKRGNPRGTYKQLAEDVAALSARREELVAALASYDAKISALAAKNEALARHEREDHLGKAIEAAGRARTAVRESERFEAAYQAAAERLSRCKLDYETASDRKAVRDRLILALGESEKAMADAAREAEESRTSLSRHDASLGAAEVKLQQMRAASQQVANLVRSLREALTHRQATALLKTREEQLAAAEEAEAKRRECIALTEEITIGKEDVAALEKLQSAYDRARLQLEAASVQIAFEPQGRRKVTVDGEPHDPGRTLYLSHDVNVHLEGFGAMAIRPGGGVETLHQAVEAASKRLADRLSTVGVSGIAEAREALTRRNTAAQEAIGHQKMVAVLAPEGLETLRQSVAGQRMLVARPLKGMAAKLDEVSETRLEDAVQLQDEAGEQEKGAEKAVAAIRQTKEEAARHLAVQTERSASAMRQHEARTQELNAALTQASMEEIDRRLASAEAALRAAEKTSAEAKTALDAAESEAVILALQRAEKAERAIRTDIETLKQGKRDLEVELRALGRDGLGEQLAEVDGQLAEAEKRLAAQQAEANAARLLYETLADAEREAKDRWLGPVRERVKPYLKLLQPDSEIVLNEQTLEIEGLRRRDVDEPFHSLSVGAREQVAVITRLALADILRSAGEPSALILDDALVNSDEARLERMHLVLNKAAEGLQILVLTCRERDFLQLGAPIRRI